MTETEIKYSPNVVKKKMEIQSLRLKNLTAASSPMQVFHYLSERAKRNGFFEERPDSKFSWAFEAVRSLLSGNSRSQIEKLQLRNDPKTDKQTFRLVLVSVKRTWAKQFAKSVDTANKQIQALAFLFSQVFQPPQAAT